MQPRNPLISTKSLFQLMPDSDSKTKPETRATSHGPKETAPNIFKHNGRKSKSFKKQSESFSKQLQHFTKLKAQSIWTIHEGTKSVRMSIRVYSFQNPIVPRMYRCETVKCFKTLKTDLVKSSKLNENGLNSMNAKTDFGPEILMLMLAKTQ